MHMHVRTIYMFRGVGGNTHTESSNSYPDFPVPVVGQEEEKLLHLWLHQISVPPSMVNFYFLVLGFGCNVIGTEREGKGADWHLRDEEAFFRRMHAEKLPSKVWSRWMAIFEPHYWEGLSIIHARYERIHLNSVYCRYEKGHVCRILVPLRQRDV